MSTPKRWIQRLSPLLGRAGKAGKKLPALWKNLPANARGWGWEHNILGICEGTKNGKPCLTVLVRNKVHQTRLANSERIPPELADSATGATLRTDIVEVGAAFQLHQAYGGVLTSGLAVGHEHGYGSGTLGVVVSSVAEPDRTFILSCAHVLAWPRLGAFPRAQAGDLVEQPVDLYDDPANRQVARLTKEFSNLRLPATTSDFALAEVLNGIRVSGQPEVRGVSERTTIPEGLGVRLLGRLTRANGSMLGLSKAAIPLVLAGGSTCTYQGLYLYATPAQEGDSGAPIVDSGNGMLLGMHIGGNGNGVGLMYPVAALFSRLGIRLRQE